MGTYSEVTLKVPSSAIPWAKVNVEASITNKSGLARLFTITKGRVNGEVLRFGAAQKYVKPGETLVWQDSFYMPETPAVVTVESWTQTDNIWDKDDGASQTIPLAVGPIVLPANTVVTINSMKVMLDTPREQRWFHAQLTITNTGPVIISDRMRIIITGLTPGDGDGNRQIMSGYIPKLLPGTNTYSIDHRLDSDDKEYGNQSSYVTLGFSFEDTPYLLADARFSGMLVPKWVNWVGGTKAPIVVITPTFYSVNMGVEPAGAGYTVPAIETQVIVGTAVSLQAIPNHSYEFDYWKVGAAKYTANPMSLVVDKSYMVVAVFKAKAIILSPSPTPSPGPSPTPTSGVTELAARSHIIVLDIPVDEPSPTNVSIIASRTVTIELQTQAGSVIELASRIATIELTIQAGEVKELASKTVVIELVVTEGKPPEEPPVDDEDVGNGTPAWIWVVSGLVIIAALTLLVVMIMRRGK